MSVAGETSACQRVYLSMPHPWHGFLIFSIAWFMFLLFIGVDGNGGYYTTHLAVRRVDTQRIHGFIFLGSAVEHAIRIGGQLNRARNMGTSPNHRFFRLLDNCMGANRSGPNQIAEQRIILELLRRQKLLQHIDLAVGQLPVCWRANHRLLLHDLRHVPDAFGKRVHGFVWRSEREMCSMDIGTKQFQHRNPFYGAQRIRCVYEES
jgi:hypothetical protein